MKKDEEDDEKKDEEEETYHLQVFQLTNFGRKVFEIIVSQV